MKQWIKRLVEQFELDWGGSEEKQEPNSQAISEDRATLLYILDIYNKHLFEIQNHSVRKVRSRLDEFAKELVRQTPEETEKTLFKIRQFISSYRIDEYTFVQNTFDDFKRIIWDFADHLSEEVQFEDASQADINQSLEQLREAVESNSIEDLRSRSRQFIGFYLKHQTSKNERRNKRIETIKKNLTSVKRQLMEAKQTMMRDHLTGAHNRKSYDEQIKRYIQLHELDKEPVSLIVVDIDHFKKINDNYGHDVGDFVLKECVRALIDSFPREEDFIARIGGEEFAIILPGCDTNAAIKKVEVALARIRKDAFVIDDREIRFTLSAGIAQIIKDDTSESWYKRADAALYESKRSGRNKYTVANNVLIKTVA